MKKRSKFLATLALIGDFAVTPFIIAGCGPANWNETSDNSEDATHPYKEIVSKINSSLTDGKEVLNNIANETLTKDISMLYADGTLFEFSKTNNYIYWTTENYKYLQLYKSETNLMYLKSYREDELENCNILAIDVSISKDDAFDYSVKNSLHIIPDVLDYVTKIEAVEDFDSYTIKVTVSYEKDSSFVIEYIVKDNVIYEMNDDGKIEFNYHHNDFTFYSDYFSPITQLKIDSTFIKDTSIIDFSMLENVNTVKISRGLTVPEYVINNFTLTETEASHYIYTKNE